ncbi:RecX family transcriptional regulator [Prevotella sp. PCHR]|uniref:Regulatory protein RecX n=1 Tax=Xylanibacter caecicola TaxID=2736294 RepID=A0ABX2AZU9_9BACT|nr:regulatory protein RecX [Xylanibacter caecicola]NPE24553.1 RecX family transcriptional regulator [Xylanibacter caecicola]
MKKMTENEALLRLSAMCASAEHCSYEMTEKMRKWELPDDAAARVMERLVNDKYIDDERYSRFFVKDKLRYNKWGRRKIDQALFMKRIPEDIRQAVLSEITDEEYAGILRPLLKSKRKSTKAASEYEMNGKLIRFAMSRGFDMDVIRMCMDCDEE